MGSFTKESETRKVKKSEVSFHGLRSVQSQTKKILKSITLPDRPEINKENHACLRSLHSRGGDSGGCEHARKTHAGADRASTIQQPARLSRPHD